MLIRRVRWRRVQVWDKEKVVIIPDHYIFTADPRANRNVDILRDFVQEQGIKYFYDITDRSNFKVSPEAAPAQARAPGQGGHPGRCPEPVVYPVICQDGRHASAH